MTDRSSIVMGCIIACGLAAPNAGADTTADGKSIAVPPFVAVESVSASTFLANKKESLRYAPEQAVLSVQDGPPGGEDGPATYSSMWCEGPPDEGVGETLTITLAQSTRVDALEIAAGVWKSERLFARNNLPTRLEVSVDGDAARTVAVPTTRERASVKLGGKPVRTIVVKIAAVKKGAINDSCLSSVALLRDGKRLDPLFDLSPPAAAALSDAIGRIVAAVDSGDLDAIAAVADFPLKVQSPHDNCTVSGEPTILDQPITHKSSKELRRDCLAYRKESPPSRANPCPTGNDEPVGVSGRGTTIDVYLHSMCSYSLAPVYTLSWRGAAWKLSQIRVDSLP